MAGSSRCDAQLNNSSSSSTENDLPSSTCDWTKGLIDKLGLRYEYKLPSDMVIEHMSSVAHLFPEEINDLEKVASKLGTVGNLNHESLLQINLAGLRWLTQSDEDVGLLRTEVPFKEIDVLRYSTYVKKFGFSLWFVLKENPSAVSEAKYRCLFQEFLQMFGIQVMAQPVINMESTKLFREKVSSCAEIVCLSQRDVEKCAVAVCEVKGECCSADQDEGPTAPKFRRTQDSPEKVPVSKEKTSLPDGLLPQHIGHIYKVIYEGRYNDRDSDIIT
ncbi:uncharacterized protein LOC125673662 isoform X4 [Ostrea edulis]|uniref:uncharacterized protein LOC125673662 isoform X4 n=1 Tax=Ostrea edulis TaxID=37623 RepID=UPI0024AFD15B|nr:uncharacterized protein LOC125673662 isoform X4 [Ostrea edulis]